MEPTQTPRESAGQELTSSPAAIAALGRWIVTATWLFVGLGIVIRLVRYLVDYPIWHDEAFLAANFWDRDYVNLLRPLDYGQVAPWLFLAIERTAVTWLGYSELSLRLFPTVCSILCLPLFRHVSGPLPGADGAASGRRGPGDVVLSDPARRRDQAVCLGPACRLDPSGAGPGSPQVAAVQPLVVGPRRRFARAHRSFLSRGVRRGGNQPRPGSQVLRSGRRAVRLGWMVYNVVLVASFLTVFLSSAVFQAADIGDELSHGLLGRVVPAPRPSLDPAALVRGYPRRHHDGLSRRRPARGQRR